MTKVNVIYGGNSSEREVSLRSGAAVADALKTAGYEVGLLDSKTASLDDMVSCDIVFPVLHGQGGEDGILQTELEARGAKYVGSGAESSRICFDKWRYRQLVLSKGLPVAEAALVQADTYRQHQIAQNPYVLKPPDGGSSIDTFIVRDPATAAHELIEDSFTRHPTMMLEQLIVGDELTVGILGDTPLPVIEIIPPTDGEFDYENKYNGKTQELCPPEHVAETVQLQAQQLALQAHQLAACRDFSRTDIMVDKAGDLYLLETNTIPGMTDQSLFPKMARTAGIDMPELCKHLVEMVLSR